MAISHAKLSTGLRTWLILLTLAALLCSVLALVFGFLINMDTKIEMNPNGDPLVRQDAIGFRVFAWGAVAVYLTLLVSGVFGGWIAYRKRRNRLSVGLSLLAAVPMLLLVLGFVIILLRSPGSV